MDIQARQKKVSKLIRKIERHQEFNRLFFMASLGVVIHALAYLKEPEKIGGVHYLGVPALALATKQAFILNKKEEQAHKVNYALQQKSFQRN